MKKLGIFPKGAKLVMNNKKYFSNMTEIHYGKTMTLTQNVVPIEPNEDLELFAKRCEEVCRIAKEVEKNHLQKE